MLQLRFFNDWPPDSKRVMGDAFCFDPAGIHAKPGGAIVARHVNDRWLVAGHLFLKLECSARVSCIFDNGARPAPLPQGPFAQLTIIEGVLAADTRPLAMLDQRRGWNSLVGDETWRGFSLVPARSS